MIDKKSDEKDALELKKIYNKYLDKRKKIMVSTWFTVEDMFSDVISKDSISPEQITEPNNFVAKKNVNVHININFDFYKPKKKRNLDYQPSAPPAYE